MGWSPRQVLSMCRDDGGAFETVAVAVRPNGLSHRGKYLRGIRWANSGAGRALEHLANSPARTRAVWLCVDAANASPRHGPLPAAVGTIDNRGSHFYIALYWAQALAEQTVDPGLAGMFAPLAKVLTESEEKIVAELVAVQGKPVDIGGYYQPDLARLSAAMRPSATFNAALSRLASD